MIKCCARCIYRSGALIDKPLIGKCIKCSDYSLFVEGEKLYERWEIEEQERKEIK